MRGGRQVGSGGAQHPPQLHEFEITEKGYLNQRAVLQRRAALVDALYANTPVAGVVQAGD